MYHVQDSEYEDCCYRHFTFGLDVAFRRPTTPGTQPKAITSTIHAESIEISAYDSCIRVKNAPVGSLLEVYSVVGIKVKEIKIKEPDAEYPVHIPKGYYIIRIGDTVRKVVIR